MYSSVYKPKKLSELTYNTELTRSLKHLSKNYPNIINILFYGIAGSGKKTRLYSFLYEIFKSDQIFNPKKKEFICNKIGTITYKICDYFIEIDPSIYGDSDKYFINDFLKELVNMKNIKSNIFRIYIIHNIDNLSHHSKKLLANIIDNNFKTARFIFTSKCISKVPKCLLSRCLNIRISVPTITDINKITRKIAEIENIKLSEKANKEIISYSLSWTGLVNVKHILNIYQLSFINSKYELYNFQPLVITNKLTELILSKNVNLEKYREYINLLYINCVNLTLVFKYFLYYFSKKYRGINNSLYFEIISILSKFEKKLILGNKKILYLESACIQLCSLF